jgi:hypothetical protein
MFTAGIEGEDRTRGGKRDAVVHRQPHPPSIGVPREGSGAAEKSRLSQLEAVLPIPSHERV